MKSTSPRPMLLLATLLFAMGASAGPPGTELPGTLRIRLMERLAPRTARVTAGPFGMAVYRGEENRVALTVGPGGVLELKGTGREIQLDSPSGGLRAASVRLEPLGPGDMSIRVGATSRSYAGELRASVARGGQLKLINHVLLEDYVASVVASEYGLDDLEGSKAMAVIARTYGLRVINSSDDSYDHVDNTASQEYRGTRAITELAMRAAQETEGEVLTYKGQLIEAVYSSSSGGHTANNEDVWQAQAHPYLRGVGDPYDRVAPHQDWESRIAVDQLNQALSSALGLDIQRIEVAQRSADGRAARIRLASRKGRDRILTSDAFRALVRAHVGEMSLKSTMFALSVKGDSYVFEGSGFGHGVGLSQYGAHGMALKGKTYREILHHYYTGVNLERRSTGGVRVQGSALLAESRQERSEPVETAGWSGRRDALAGRLIPGQGTTGVAAGPESATSASTTGVTSAAGPESATIASTTGATWAAGPEPANGTAPRVMSNSAAVGHKRSRAVTDPGWAARRTEEGAESDAPRTLDRAGW